MYLHQYIFHVKEKRRKRNLLFPLFSSQSMFFMHLGFIESYENLSWFKVPFGLLVRKGKILFWVKIVNLSSTRPSRPCMDKSAQKSTYSTSWMCIYREQFDLIRTLTRLSKFCAKKRRKKTSERKNKWRSKETERRSMERILVFLFPNSTTRAKFQTVVRAENFRYVAGAKKSEFDQIWRALTSFEFVEFDLLE